MTGADWKGALPVESKGSRSRLYVWCACARWLLWESAQGAASTVQNAAWRIVRLLRERRRTGLCTSSCHVGSYCSTTVLLVMYSLRVFHCDLQVQNVGQFWNFGFAARPRQMICCIICCLQRERVCVCVCVCVWGWLIQAVSCDAVWLRSFAVVFGWYLPEISNMSECEICRRLKLSISLADNTLKKMYNVSGSVSDVPFVWAYHFCNAYETGTAGQSQSR